MKKGLIFIGPARSGKSRAALEIAAKFNNAVVILDRNNFHGSWPFNNLTKNTELLIIDELRDISYINRFLGSNLYVDKQCQKGFTINPQIIVVCDAKITLSDFIDWRLFRHYFDIIEFPIKVKAETLLASIISL